MQIQYMWGKSGEYGPFSADKDGYPNAGEIVRYYRESRKLSAKKFGELYGNALGEHPKSRIWVLAMERKNDVPSDITRRRVIANLLGIPYALLGLSESLAKKPLMVDAPPKPLIPKRETLAQEVLAEHQQSLVLYFAGFYHRHGQAALNDIALATRQLSTAVPLMRERAKHSGIALLSRYHQFGINVAREQRNYELALSHADKAIEYAQDLHEIKPNSDLMAVAYLRRGLTSFEQAITRQGQDGSLSDTVTHIDAALSHARHAMPLMKGLIGLEWGLVHAYAAQTPKERTAVRVQLEDSHNYLPMYRAEDDENFVKFTPEWYHLTYAEALIALGDHAEAIGELELAEELTPLTLPRRFAYIDLLRAKAYIDSGEFEEAVIYAKDALAQSKAVKSEFNIARIAQVYRQLRGESKRFSGATELEKELAKTHPYLVLI